MTSPALVDSLDFMQDVERDGLALEEVAGLQDLFYLGFCVVM